MIKYIIRRHPTRQPNKQRICRFIYPTPRRLDEGYQRDFTMQRLVDGIKGFACQTETGRCHAVETIEYFEKELGWERSDGRLTGGQVRGWDMSELYLEQRKEWWRSWRLGTCRLPFLMTIEGGFRCDQPYFARYYHHFPNPCCICINDRKYVC